MEGVSVEREKSIAESVFSKVFPLDCDLDSDLNDLNDRNNWFVKADKSKLEASKCWEKLRDLKKELNHVKNTLNQVIFANRDA